MPEFENIEKFEIRSSKGEVQIPPIAPHSLNSMDYVPGGTRYVGRSPNKRPKKDKLAEVTIEPVDIRQMEKDFRTAARGDASLFNWLLPDFFRPSYWIRKWHKARGGRKIKLRGNKPAKVNKPAKKGSPKIILRSEQTDKPAGPNIVLRSAQSPQNNSTDGNSSRRRRQRRPRGKGNSPDNNAPADKGSQQQSQSQPPQRERGQSNDGDHSNRQPQGKRNPRRRNRGDGGRNRGEGGGNPGDGGNPGHQRGNDQPPAN